MIEIYTDGSCNTVTKCGGYAAIFVCNGQAYEFSGREDATTNSRMEMTGIINALSHISKPNEYVLYSDSAFIVAAITNRAVRKWAAQGWTSNKKAIANVDLWEKYISEVKRIYALGATLSVQKVAGHAGNKYNERADVLAKLARA